MKQIQYIDAPCRTALNRVRGMPFNWSLNPYRGCTHRCHYCYARATHSYLGLNPGDDFGSQIFVKSNIAALLRREVSAPSWTGEQIAIGTATDPYQPCEGRLGLTRSCLEVLTDRQNLVSIVTKSTLIHRDADLLAELSRVSKASVYFTVTTLDPAIWRAIEPGTPPPLQRLRVMERLAAAGIECGVFLAPVVPLVTDSAESISAVARVAAAHGATSFGSSVLRLVPLVKEHWFSWLSTSAPHLLSRYERSFTGMEAPSEYRRFVEARVEAARLAAGFGSDSMRHARNVQQRDGGVRNGRQTPEQLKLAV